MQTWGCTWCWLEIRRDPRTRICKKVILFQIILTTSKICWPTTRESGYWLDLFVRQSSQNMCTGRDLDTGQLNLQYSWIHCNHSCVPSTAYCLHCLGQNHLNQVRLLSFPGLMANKCIKIRALFIASLSSAVTLGKNVVLFTKLFTSA